MIRYHVYGKVVEEKYYIGSNANNHFSAKWIDRKYSLNKSTSIDRLFNEIYGINVRIHERYYGFNYNNFRIDISDICLKRDCILKEYKEFKTIDIEPEAIIGQVIQVDGIDYEAKYKYNCDKKQHELHIDKIVEKIIDEEELEYAQQLCNNLIKKIKEYNKTHSEITKELRGRVNNINNEVTKTKELLIKLKKYLKENRR